MRTPMTIITIEIDAPSLVVSEDEILADLNHGR